MRKEMRATWKNWAGNQSVTPELSFWPDTRDDVVEIVREAERKGLPVRAVGSGHSWSDVAKTEGCLVYPQGLTRVLDIDAYQLREVLPVPKHLLVQVESGITIRALSAALHLRGLALINLGGYDGQTICGVTSTSTHGSGIAFLPLCDFIRSMEIVASGGKIWRIEPSADSGQSITDPAAFAAAFPDRDAHELVQDDDWFYAAMVGMGCLGIIYSVVLEVREKFLLKETRELTTWSEAKNILSGERIRLIQEHFELLLNPYRVDGDNRCLITRRVETDVPGDRERSIYIKYKAVLDVSAWWVRLLSTIWPSKIRNTLDSAIEALVDDDFTDQSFKVFHIGDANDIRVLSAEYAVPVDGDTWVAAVDSLIETAERVARERKQYLTVPVAVRFVKGTRALLSPMHGRDTCMLEVIGLRGVKPTESILRDVEQALRAHDMRPHWGQVNHVTPESMRAMYPGSLPRWMAVHDTLNARRTFTGPFTRRVGL
jgi:L-gulono-1,4-lactone dehydrogenase